MHVVVVALLGISSNVLANRVQLSPVAEKAPKLSFEGKVFTKFAKPDVKVAYVQLPQTDTMESSYTRMAESAIEGSGVFLGRPFTWAPPSGSRFEDGSFFPPDGLSIGFDSLSEYAMGAKVKVSCSDPTLAYHNYVGQRGFYGKDAPVKSKESFKFEDVDDKWFKKHSNEDKDMEIGAFVLKCGSGWEVDDKKSNSQLTLVSSWLHVKDGDEDVHVEQDHVYGDAVDVGPLAGPWSEESYNELMAQLGSAAGGIDAAPPAAQEKEKKDDDDEAYWLWPEATP